MRTKASGFEVSAETISNITNRVLVDVKEWQSRALKPVYSVVFMDGMVFKVKKDGVIQKCTAYACIGVDLDGQKEVLSDINSTFGKHKQCFPPHFALLLLKSGIDIYWRHRECKNTAVSISELFMRRKA